MVVLDEDFGADLTLVEGDGGVRSSPAAEPVRPPRDWQMLYEQGHARAERERVRADAAEARAEELRWAEVAARSDGPIQEKWRRPTPFALLLPRI